MNPAHQIDILVTKRSNIPDSHIENKFHVCNEKDVEFLCSNAEYKWRADMEEDPTYKQFIPYVVVTNKKNQVLVYKRSTKGGEGRLYNKYSLAVGGHVDKIDGLSKFENLYAMTEQEIEEEIGLDISIDDINILGTINDTGGVNEMHMGIAMKLEVDTLDLEKGEQDMLLERKFMNKNEILDIYDSLESWSQIFFDHHLQNTL